MINIAQTEVPSRRSIASLGLCDLWKAPMPANSIMLTARFIQREEVLRKPTIGIAACCACAAIGQVTAAPPKSVMNSRRRMTAPNCRNLHTTGSN